MGDANIKPIRKFLNQMASQDRRATADIFYYVIRDKIQYQSDPENCDEKRYYQDDETYNSKYDLAKELFRMGCEKEEVERKLRNAHEYGISYRWENKQMFLTETDAKDHLRLNHYHYSPDAYVYICHAWRAPELLEFFKCLFDFFDIGKEWG